MGAKQWKAPHFGNGWLSVVVALIDTNMRSGATVRSSSRCIEKAARRRCLLEARTRSSTLGWCVRLVKSLALIGRNCQGRRVEFEATRCCHLKRTLALKGRDQGEGDVYQHPDTNGRIGTGWESCRARYRLGQADRRQSHRPDVLPPFHTFTTDTQMIEDTPAQYKTRMQKQAEKPLAPSPTPRRQRASHARPSRSSTSIPTRRSSIPRSPKAAI